MAARTHSRPLRRAVLIALAAAVSPLLAGPLRGQADGDARLPRRDISGLVVDAATGAPLARASVALEPEDSGVVPRRGAPGASFLPMGLSTTTNDAGEYRFGELPEGRYRIRAERVGYRPVSVAVDFRDPEGSQVSLGLTVRPIPLQPVEVTGTAPDPYGRSRTSTAERGDARLAALRQRQRISLASDSREITHADVVEAVTLGETDLFRALQRLPGVTTRDDYSAELWVRGASWDQSRVYFDGLPLFNPVHAVGVLSGVSTSVVGAAWLHPGARSASLAEGVAGVLDLRSRRGDGDGEVNGYGDLSVFSSSLALDQRILDGRGAWMISGRRSYLDLVTRAIGALADDPGIHMPYAFSDLAGRFDYQVDARRSLEVSGLWERDSFSGDLPDIVHGNAAAWGNVAARVTWQAPFRGLQARHTVGVSRYGARVREVPSNPDLPYDAGTAPPSRNSMLYAKVGSRFEPRGEGGARRWAAGYEAVVQALRYRGPPPTRDGEWIGSDTQTFVQEGALGMIALWGERSWRPEDRFTLDAGMRVELGSDVRDGGIVRPAPRIAARYQVSSALALSGGWARVYQYSQTAGLTGPYIYFATDRLRVLAGEEHPVLRGDVATVGAEAWFGGGWVGAATGYWRASTGVAIDDPVPGRVDEQRPFVFGDNRAQGIELSVRRITGRLTGSLGYAYASSQMEAEGLSYPADEDRRHSLSATGMVRAGESLRLGAAYMAFSGAPITRGWSRDGVCDGTGCDYHVAMDPPNEGRAPGYASLDLLLDFTRPIGSWDVSAYLQLRNVLGHDNSILYSGSNLTCTGLWTAEGCSTGWATQDRFDPGIPTIPLIGFRVRF